MGAADSMEFESTLALKALPGREFRQNPVIDAHRCMTSLQPCASCYLGAIRFSRGIFRRVRLYTRKRLPRSGFVSNTLSISCAIDDETLSGRKMKGMLDTM